MQHTIITKQMCVLNELGITIYRKRYNLLIFICCFICTFVIEFLIFFSNWTVKETYICIVRYFIVLFVSCNLKGLTEKCVEEDFPVTERSEVKLYWVDKEEGIWDLTPLIWAYWLYPTYYCIFPPLSWRQYKPSWWPYFTYFTSFSIWFFKL